MVNCDSEWVNYNHSFEFNGFEDDLYLFYADV